jgi:hypothetical protein
MGLCWQDQIEDDRHQVKSKVDLESRKQAAERKLLSCGTDALPIPTHSRH